MKLTKCECPEKGIVSKEREYQYSEKEKAGMNHLPNECKGTYDLARYKRGNKTLTLCSCCTLWGDILIPHPKPEEVGKE